MSNNHQEPEVIYAPFEDNHDQTQQQPDAILGLPPRDITKQVRIKTPAGILIINETHQKTWTNPQTGILETREEITFGTLEGDLLSSNFEVGGICYKCNKPVSKLSIMEGSCRCAMCYRIVCFRHRKIWNNIAICRACNRIRLLKSFGRLLLRPFISLPPPPIPRLPGAFPPMQPIENMQGLAQARRIYPNQQNENNAGRIL